MPTSAQRRRVRSILSGPSPDPQGGFALTPQERAGMQRGGRLSHPPLQNPVVRHHDIAG